MYKIFTGHKGDISKVYTEDARELLEPQYEKLEPKLLVWDESELREQDEKLQNLEEQLTEGEKNEDKILEENERRFMAFEKRMDDKISKIRTIENMSIKEIELFLRKKKLIAASS